MPLGCPTDISFHVTSYGKPGNGRKVISRLFLCIIPAVSGNIRKTGYGDDRTGKLWKAALYLRLSREDEDKGESNSITNQKKMLMDFVKEQPDLEIYDIYVDDGFSGTSFKRPSFMEMIKDIQEERADCVIVKDLSRFGRNYIDAGEYLEKLFPRLKVRFIAVNDGIDSVKDPQSMNTILVPFRNLINDEYCRDISNKVRSSLDMKRRQGQHIGSFACYGYKKDPKDHNHLVKDEEAAGIVRKIFSWYVEGMSAAGIAKRLNSEGVPSPSRYKEQQGLNYRNSHGCSSDGRWSDSSIRRILSNRMYVGDLVQGVMKTTSYKVQISVRQPQEEWIIVNDAHEALISREVFEMAEEIRRRHKRTSPMAEKRYLFSGYLKCGDCGKGMIRKKLKQGKKEYVYYVCSTYTKKDKKACSKHTIREEWLEEKVLAAVKSQICLAVDMERARKSVEEGRDRTEENRIRSTIRHILGEIETTRKIMLDLYPDWKAGVISKEEYISLKQNMNREIREKEDNLRKLEEKMKRIEKEGEAQDVFLKKFLEFKDITGLSRHVVASLIKMIYIYEDLSIKIEFRYQDPFI